MTAFTPALNGFCWNNIEKCSYGYGFTTTGATPAIVPPPADTTDAMDAQGGFAVRPDCTKSQTEQKDRVWCTTNAPTPGAQYSAIQRAINNMTTLGGVCASLASIAEAALTRGDIHMFPNSAGYGFGAFSGGNGTSAFIGLDDYWTNAAPDFDHLDGSGRDLQEILAHEADHIYTQTSTHLDSSGFTTTHSEQCRGY